jgi:TetR/AcrR family transcriptional repressor of lmrAB and yxaGH operons
MAEVPTRQKMIETAVRLFQRQGYHATSWRTLVEEAGTPWGSAHHHFPGGKEQLGAAAIELGAAAVTAEIERLFAVHAGPAAAIRAWCRASAERLEDSGFVAGCPIATVALEAASTSPLLGKACQAAFGEWTHALTERLGRAGMARKRAAELASLAVLSVEGALLCARVARSQAPLLLAGEQLAALVEASL